jgi:hypothetical protein
VAWKPKQYLRPYQIISLSLTIKITNQSVLVFILLIDPHTALFHPPIVPPMSVDPNVTEPNWTFICFYAYPGIPCHYGEMIAISVLFFLASLVSIFFIVYSFRRSRSRCRIDQIVLFWFFLAIWQIYHGVISLVPIHWDLVTYRLWYGAANHILLFIPMCLVILTLFELLFANRNPPADAIIFFRALFVLFLLTFVALGIVLCTVDLDNASDVDESLSLWSACTDLILALFFALPARSLLEILTYPQVQDEDTCCVNFCKVGIASYVLLFGGRMIWNGTYYFHANKAQDWLNGASVDGKSTAARRVVVFLFVLFFDFGTSVLGMISVYLFKKHDIMFNDNPYYTRND